MSFINFVLLTMDLSRFRAAPSARLGHFPFEIDVFSRLMQG